MVFEEVFDAVEGFRNLVDSRCIGAAYMTFTAGTEGTAGDEGYMLGSEQLFSELVGSVTCGFDGGEDVESAFRLEAFQPHLG